MLLILILMCNHDHDNVSLSIIMQHADQYHTKKDSKWGLCALFICVWLEMNNSHHVHGPIVSGQFVLHCEG